MAIISFPLFNQHVYYCTVLIETNLITKEVFFPLFLSISFHSTRTIHTKINSSRYLSFLIIICIFRRLSVSCSTGIYLFVYFMYYHVFLFLSHAQYRWTDIKMHTHSFTYYISNFFIPFPHSFALTYNISFKLARWFEIVTLAWFAWGLASLNIRNNALLEIALLLMRLFLTGIERIQTTIEDAIGFELFCFNTWFPFTDIAW